VIELELRAEIARLDAAIEAIANRPITIGMPDYTIARERERIQRLETDREHVAAALSTVEGLAERRALMTSEKQPSNPLPSEVSEVIADTLRRNGVVLR
jgi:hypothetical protein